MRSVQNVSASVFQIQGESHTQTPLLQNTETKRLSHGSPNSYFWHLTILVILFCHRACFSILIPGFDILAGDTVSNIDSFLIIHVN